MTLLCLLFFPCLAITQNDYDMDELALNTPAASTYSVNQLANYFVKKIPDDRARVRAIFAWVTMNVRYLNTNRDNEIWATPEHFLRQQPEQVLSNRTAVCQGFANLFQALCKASGIESQVVTGIVKDREGAVMSAGHAWVAAEIMGEWRLFDPTWSIPSPMARWRVNDAYFMVAPAQLVLNHLPDDPAWQLLENPISEADFRENDEESITALIQKKGNPGFDFRDTLKNWIAMDSVERTFSSEGRILAFNGSNQRILFGLGQSYWGAFFDLSIRLDSLADRAIMQDSIFMDTLYFSAQLALMEKYQSHARTLFEQLTDPKRIAQSEKFYSPTDVAAISSKLRGAMWTAVFENQFSQTSSQINEASLKDLAMTLAAADQAYHQAILAVDCQKLAGTCFEIWHNLSLAHLQLAERYALFSQRLLAEKSAAKYLETISLAIENAEKWYKQAETETHQLLQIPPPYAFVLERLQTTQQGLYSLKVLKIKARRVALTGQIESALATSNRPKNMAKSLTGKLQAIVEDLESLSQTIEDAYSALGADYCLVTLYNIRQEGYAMQFNLGNLYFRAALDAHQNATEKSTLPEEKKRIEGLIQKAGLWLKEARQSLDALEKSQRASRTFTNQCALKINQLSKSIQVFSDAL